MIRRLAIFVLLTALAAFAQGSGYTYARSLTVSSSLVTGTNTNFPMLFVGGSYLATVANGGRLTSSSGYDHIYSASSACTSPLNYETESGSYVATTGVLYDWVQIPSLTNASIIYICYGNSSITTYQGTSAAWDSTFAGVWHMPPSGSSLCSNSGSTIPDSTANANNGLVASNPTNPTTCIAGQINGAYNNPQIQISNDLVVANAASLQIAQKITISAWVNVLSYNSSHANCIVSKATGGGTANYLFCVGGAEIGGVTGKLAFYNGSNISATGTSVPLSTWDFVTVAIDETAGTKITFYQQGTVDSTPSYAGTMTSSNTAEVDLASWNPVSSEYALLGAADEIHIANVTRPSTWILTEYNSENSPCGSGTFCTVGSELGGGTNRSRISVMQH